MGEILYPLEDRVSVLGMDSGRPTKVVVPTSCKE